MKLNPLGVLLVVGGIVAVIVGVMGTQHPLWAALFGGATPAAAPGYGGGSSSGTHNVAPGPAKRPLPNNIQ